ncbi:hypothetical protein KHA80_07640 [Anaerobacillus sp. HL2]|nr:hypothetical protein KHA80_07640 [Anaerobacillus sp. HL2]
METGVFSDVPPDEYLVITPMSDRLDLFADNEAYDCFRQGYPTKKNYNKRKKGTGQKPSKLRDKTACDKVWVSYENDKISSLRHRRNERI